MAKFFLDENLPTSLCETLRDLGHECKHVRDVGLTGASDEIIAEYAKSKTLILVTKDAVAVWGRRTTTRPWCLWGG